MTDLDKLLSGEAPEPESTGPIGDELTIENVLLHYGAKRIPHGAGWKAMKCPFHNDGTASGSVNHSKNAFKCHTGKCGISGDAAGVIMKVEKITRREAIEQARRIFGASVGEVSRPIRSARKRRPLGSERWAELLG
ncbi:MAG: CHC2 zinc finger domain-containing protein [Candidatus Saccharimonadales bacterium]